MISWQPDSLGIRVFLIGFPSECVYFLPFICWCHFSSVCSMVDGLQLAEPMLDAMSLGE